MDFARSQLEKYGWKEGEGLGKNKDGKAVPIRTALKLNSYGVGFNAGKEYANNWWERIFNEAASNIQAVKDKKGTVTAVETLGEVNISTKRKRKGSEKLTYGTFKKKSCLNGSTEAVLPVSSSESSCDEEIGGVVSNDKLFEICGGRTGHKGSRHGLTMSGKLARLEQQEKKLSFLKTDDMNGKRANPSASVEEVPENSKKKEKKDKKKKKKKKLTNLNNI